MQEKNYPARALKGDTLVAPKVMLILDSATRMMAVFTAVVALAF
jgi:hypothetical protein